MMTGIDCRPPDAQTDAGEEHYRIPAFTAHHSINRGEEHIGSMQARHGSKDIGILAIESVEHVQSGHCVPSAQTSHIARCIEHSLEAIVHRIPGRSSRIDVVADEADDIHQQESPGETLEPVKLFRKIQIKGKGDRHRNPAEIEDACPEIGKTAMVNLEVFARNHQLGMVGYSLQLCAG